MFLQVFYIAKLHPLTANKIISILKDNGFKEVRSGKHITFKKTDSSSRVWTTWVPHQNEVTVFVLRYIIRQSGKDRKEFE